MDNTMDKYEVLLALFLKSIESRELPQKGSFLHNTLSETLRTSQPA
jgi:hypothetical protein